MFTHLNKNSNLQYFKNTFRQKSEALTKSYIPNTPIPSQILVYDIRLKECDWPVAWSEVSVR